MPDNKTYNLDEDPNVGETPGGMIQDELAWTGVSTQLNDLPDSPHAVPRSLSMHGAGSDQFATFEPESRIEIRQLSPSHARLWWH